VQPRAATPRAVWNPDLETPEDFRGQWLEVPDNEDFDNGFKVQWEHFLRHVADGEPFPWDLLEGAKGVQLAELGLRSAAEGRRIEVPALELDREGAPA
jgi:predicted dehydrogenase